MKHSIKLPLFSAGLALGLASLASAQASTPMTITAKPYVTAEKTELRLSPQAELSFVDKPQVLETEPTVFVDATHSFQTLVGIGGALTDSSAETFDKLPAAAQQEFMTAYFDADKGIGYTLARTNIASCDFSSASYAYVKDNDAELKSFSVAHDEAHKIPFIKRAFSTAKGNIVLFGSPWSPPAWMKDNGSLLKGGKLKPEFRQAWANHYVEFVKAFEAHGIPIWGLSVQNEPMAVQKWESCIFTAEEERDYIRDFVGPTLAKAGLSRLKLIAWDHNRDLIYHRASTILNDPKAAQYVWGIGFHWYETWTKSGMMFDNLRRVHEAFPSVNLIFTEGCAESFDASRIHNWALGEHYGLSMINDFNAGTVAWTDWNVLLDEKGGPNHVGNFCFAPVHADTKTGKLIYTNAYYYIGHFSKFVRPGAKRIAVTTTRDALHATGFVNTDGTTAVVVMNTGDSALDYQLWIGGKAAPVHSLPHSMSTVLIK